MPKNASYVLLFFVLLISSASGRPLKSGTALKLSTEPSLRELTIAPHFAAAEACTVRHDKGMIYQIDNYFTGGELYKAYQDPSKACSGAYPFSVEEVDMIFHFAQICTLFVSVDVESADLTTPSCPQPGALLSISTEYMYALPDTGFYLLAVPLDSTLIINSPYFVGFYISNLIDASTGVGLISDDTPVQCVNYNIWDNSIGYIDMTNNDYYNFPGRLLLYSVGTTGGSGPTPPAPSITLLKPSINEAISGPAVLWASETSGSPIIEYVIFNYRSNSGSWIEIGRDNDGNRALRNGVNESGTGGGYSLAWNYGVLAEGTYWVKATVYDTLGRSAADSHQVSLDPTPPDLIITSPINMDTICLPLKIEATTTDENITQVRFERKAAPLNYGAPVVTLNQSLYGDNNGNPHDGNHASAGEYGDYYCGPVAGALAIKYWYDKGFIYGMREGRNLLPIDTVVERLAANMQTRANKGTYDDLFYSGLLQYTLTHGNELDLEIYRYPHYALFRTLLEERELFLVLALSGAPGIYLAAAGVSGLSDSQGRYAMTVSDPLTGNIISAYMKNNAGMAQVYYGNSWHNLDMIITIMGYSHMVSRDLIGMDTSAAGGWNWDWISADMIQDSLYFLTATATDATNRTGTATNLIQYGCASLKKGDYDGDGLANVGDVLYLINYIFKNGATPMGGIGRADANCDGAINISDVVFAIRFIYSHGPTPCY
ncbi:MAG: dockerin type I domain-containing protein [candidate division Zixibacteria bacterium]|nr:dockerin type I domain-containing protein [candidate division Zixibacteria bacterium]